MVLFMDTASTLFPILIAIALVALLGVVGAQFLMRRLKGPAYRRTKPYALKSGHFEFRVLGIGGFEDAEDFIAYLLQASLGQILDQNLELDDVWWRIGVPTDWITVFFDDPAGLRVRSKERAQHGLFGRLLRDLKPA